MKNNVLNSHHQKKNKKKDCEYQKVLEIPIGSSSSRHSLCLEKFDGGTSTTLHIFSGPIAKNKIKKCMNLMKMCVDKDVGHRIPMSGKH